MIEGRVLDAIQFGIDARSHMSGWWPLSETVLHDLARFKTENPSATFSDYVVARKAPTK